MFFFVESQRLILQISLKDNTKVMAKCISSWTELGELDVRTLLVLDIDETLLWFPKVNREWWIDLLAKLAAKHPPDRVQALAQEEWLRVVTEENPVQTDVEGFRELNRRVRATNSQLVFLTARLESFSYLTRKHLNYCGVSQDTVIHYSSSKGATLRAILAKYPGFKRVVFVDDKVSNIEDVQKHNPTVEVYQWIIAEETC